MSISIEAVYEKGVLRPLEPLNLREHQRVTMTISESVDGACGEEWLDADCVASCAREADEGISLDEVRKALSKLPGSLTADFISERQER